MIEKILQEKIRLLDADSAHDYLHIERVVNNAKKLCERERGNKDVVLPAAYLHDFIVLPKNHPDRKKASTLSAEAAVLYLKEIEYNPALLDQIAHAIAAHSFSAQIKPETLEAKIVQDADRLDGIGAIGVARCFATSGTLNRIFYDSKDPFCRDRKPDDSIYTLDHFYQKLFLTAESMQTTSGKEEAAKRVERMRLYLQDLEDEL